LPTRRFGGSWRVDCNRDPSLDVGYPARWPAAAEIILRDGRRVATRIEHATGEPENPVTREALVDKFVSLAVNLLAPGEARSIAERVLHLEDETSLRDVARELAG